MLKHTFIPHKGNDHKPQLLEEAGIVALVVIVVGMFLLSGVHTIVLQNSSRFLAAVLPNVLVDLTNDSRADEASLGPLTINPVLQVAAQLKANDMAEKSYFAHTSPEGISPWHWFEEAGYNYLNAGENLAVNFVDSEDVVQAWLDSPSHRANILNGSFREIGIATSEGFYKGQKVVFVVQLFGTPLGGVIVPSPEPTVEPIVLGEKEILPAETAEPAQVRETAPEMPTAETEKSTETPTNQEKFLTLNTETTSRVEIPQEAVVEEESAGEVEEVHYSTVGERLATSPQQSLKLTYMIVGLIILLVMVLVAVIEFRKHHFKNLAYACLVIVLMGMMWYIQLSLFSNLGAIA